MKKIVLLALVMSIFFTSQAQQKNVAVYIASEQSSVTKILGDQLVAAFSKSSEYKAIERTSSFLAEISKEQGYQRSGAVDDKEISRLGKQFGVQYVCIAEISEAFGKKYISARLINVENAEIVSSANEYSDLNSMEELIRVSDVLKSQLLNLKLNVRRNTARVAEGYTDLGLPSGTIWKNFNTSGRYTFDEAVSQFGGHLPTKENWEELKSECQWSWTDNGYRVTGPNGNSIFLPAEGLRYSNGYVSNVGTYGCYWSSTVGDSNNAWDLGFTSISVNIEKNLRYIGFSVRLIQN